MTSQKLKSAAATAVIAGASFAGLWCVAIPAWAAAVGPFTQEQVDSGRDAFQDDCAACHKADLTGDQGPALIGKKFVGNWGGKSTGELYKYIHDNMPACSGGSLSTSDYAEITAFVLWANGANPGPDELRGADATPMVSDVVATPRAKLTK